MAYTKIIPIHHHLERAINYALNPSKTEECLYTGSFNCGTDTACLCMIATKERWNKTGPGHVLGYHLIQSFAHGEVTPEQAHQIGMEFVKRCLSDRYEVVIGTHLDRGHLHNHIACAPIRGRVNPQ